jgi:hypothetical protein
VSDPRLSPFWGDPVRSPEGLDEGSQVSVGTAHEGISVLIEHPDAAASIWLGPEEARHLARNLVKAADQWEED